MMKSTEERLMSLEDDMAIRKLVAKFADATTIADHEEFKSLWKPDGVFTINQPASVTKTGIDEISALIMQLRDDRDFFVHFVHSGVIEVDGNTATARWIIHEVAQGPGEKYYNNYGLFNDKMEKIKEKWVFTSRVYDYMWIDTGKFPGKTVKLPKYL
jgi:SnoaL-like domain